MWRSMEREGPVQRSGKKWRARRRRLQMTTASRTQLEVTEAWAWKTQWFLLGCCMLGLGKEIHDSKEERILAPVSLPREFQKGDRTRKQGADPPRSTASFKSISSACCTCYRVLRVPRWGALLPHKRPMKKQTSVLKPDLSNRSNKVLTTLMALCVFEARCTSSFQHIQIYDGCIWFNSHEMHITWHTMQHKILTGHTGWGHREGQARKPKVQLQRTG